ncbi:PE family protein [Mycobacterium paraense]|nr:PE family protein [Mycobacterium paraense]
MCRMARPYAQLASIIRAHKRIYVVHSRGEMNMSFVVAVPDLVEVAAQDLASIRSALDEVTEAILAPTTSLAPAASDEVSTAIAALFGNFGQEYQALNAEVAAFHNAFVGTLSGGAAAYTGAEIANSAAMLSGGGNLAAELGAAISGFGAALSGSLSAGLNSSLGAALGGTLETLLGAGLGGLVFQTGGFILSGIGNGMVQTGNAIVQAGLALENSGAALSAMGGPLLAQANAALNALLNANFGLDLSAALSASLGGSLTGLAANLAAGLNGLGSLAGNLGAGLNGALQTGATLAGNFLAALPGLPALTFPNLGPLGVQLSAALNGLGANLNASLSGLLSGALTLPPINLSLPGLPSFTLPPLPGLPSITLPNLAPTSTPH